MHRKHPKLIKPQVGLFHAKEIAILGAACKEIENLVQSLKAHKAFMNWCYVDEYHGDARDAKIEGMTKSGGHHHYILNPSKAYDPYMLLKYAGAFINGNHFEGKCQILVYNENKQDSLVKRTNQITAPILVLNAADQYDAVFMRQWVSDDVPVIDISDIEEVISVIEVWLHQQIPNLKGLILAGGKSQRMGVDKTQLVYRDDLPQMDYLRREMKSLELDLFISVRQYTEAPDSIIDTFIDLGPYGAILSAFRADPSAAWLTCPCDAPFIDQELFQILIDHRDSDKLATCFFNPETGWPESLIAIWEPKAYPVMLQYLSRGISCPRKVLINEDIVSIDLGESAYKLANINTPEERLQILPLFAKKP